MVGNYLYYYDRQTAEDIAGAIEKVNTNEEYDSRKLIDELNIKFIKDLKGLLEQ